MCKVIIVYCFIATSGERYILYIFAKQRRTSPTFASYIQDNPWSTTKFAWTITTTTVSSFLAFYAKKKGKKLYSTYATTHDLKTVILLFHTSSTPRKSRECVNIMCLSVGQGFILISARLLYIYILPHRERVREISHFLFH